MTKREQVLDVSIVIVSWNTSDYLVRCLGLLDSATKGLTTEVIVVDNGSSDGSQAVVAAQFPKVRLIQNADNLGYGRACNIGVQASCGRTVLLLNSDCELTPGSVTTMVETLDQDPSLGGVFCRLVNPDGSLQPSVHESLPSPWSMFGDLLLFSSLRYVVYRNPALHRWVLRSTLLAHQRSHDVQWGGAACLLVRQTVFKAVGGFDERFFLYWEDIDLCKRIRDTGFRLRYIPKPVAVHHWGRSTAKAPDFVLREAYCSRIYYFGKHFPSWGGLLARWLTTGELGIRQSLLTFLARLPIPTRWAFRERAAANRACLRYVLEHNHQLADERSPELRPTVLLVLLVLLFSGFSYLHDLIKVSLESPFIDFAHYYTYATVVAQGQDLFDPEAVARIDASLQIRRALSAANYPPLFYLLMQPWVLLPFRPAALAWLFFNQLCLMGALVLCFRHVPVPSPVGAVVALFVVLNYQPLKETIALGQANILLLFLTTLAWHGLRAQRPWLTVGSVALTVHIKAQFGLLIPLLWWIGHRSIAARALIVASAGVGISLTILGLPHHLQYLQYLQASMDSLLSWSANLSPAATVRRLVGESVNTGPILMVCDALLLLFFSRILPRTAPAVSSAMQWSWGLGLSAILLLSPLTEEHHLVLLLLPLTLLILSEPASNPADLILLVLAVLLLGSRYSFEQFSTLHAGWPSLLMTGKLLGIMTLTWLLIRRLRHAGRAEL